MRGPLGANVVGGPQAVGPVEDGAAPERRAGLDRDLALGGRERSAVEEDVLVGPELEPVELGLVVVAAHLEHADLLARGRELAGDHPSPRPGADDDGVGGQRELRLGGDDRNDRPLDLGGGLRQRLRARIADSGPVRVDAGAGVGQRVVQRQAGAAKGVEAGRGLRIRHERGDDRLPRLLRELGAHALGGERVEETAETLELLGRRPRLQERQLHRHRHAVVARRARPEAGRIGAVGGLERRHPGVAERRERRAPEIVEELAGSVGRHRLGDLRGDLADVGQHVDLAGRRVAGGDEDRLPARVLADPVGAVPRAEAGLLPAAHRQLESRVVELGVVDAGDPGLDPARDLLAAGRVAGPDRRLEPIAALVRQRHRLLGVGDAHHRERRAEGLLGHAQHRVIDAGEHGRLVEAAGPLADPAPGPDLGAALDRVADVGVDQLELGREDDRADVDGAEIAGGTLTERRDALREPVDELVVDGFLDVDPLDRDADLAAVVEAVADRRVHRPLDVGIGEDDHRVLAAELEADRRQRLGRLRHHLLAGLDRAREHDVVDEIDERRTGPSPPGRDREDAVGDPGLGQHLGHQERRQRGHLGRLQDHGVARHQRRDAVSEGVDQREVPGADDTDDTGRLVAHLELAPAPDRGRGGLDDLVGQHPGGALRPELERGGAVSELGEERLVGGLAGLAADRLDDPVAVGHHPGARRHQHPSALLESGLPPRGLGRPGGGGDGFDLGAPEVGHGGERLAGRRVVHRDAGSVGRRLGVRAR